MPEFFEPPAEVKPAQTLAERAARVRLMHKACAQRTLEAVRDIGAELRAAKEQCVRENKPWLPWLEEAKVDRTTASRYMRIAEHWSLFVDYDAAMHQGGLTGALNFLAGVIQDEREIHGQQAPPPPKSGAAGMAPAPPRPAKLCPRCARKGYQINCEECQRLNGGKAAPRADPPDREPGDDTELEEKVARLDPRELAKKVSAYLWRQLKPVAEVYGLKVGKSYADPETDPRFRPLIRKLGEARKEAELLARKLNQGEG